MPDEASVRRHHAGRGRLVIGPAFADGSGDPAAVKQEDGKYYDKDGNPTYKVQSDGTVDWYTYSGFRRYHSDCHTCHRPDREGSSYAFAVANEPLTRNGRVCSKSQNSGNQDIINKLLLSFD